jgi:hypothetical protein
MAIFDNPEKLARSRELSDKRYEFFIDLFGSDEKVGPGEEIAADLERFRSTWAEQDPPPALYPDTVNVIPEQIEKASDVGMVMDPKFGLGLMKSYAAFMKICESGSETDEDGDTLSIYVANLEKAPPAWQRAFQRFPEGTLKVLEARVGPEGAREIQKVLENIFEVSEQPPPVVAVLDPELAAAIPALPQNSEGSR